MRISAASLQLTESEETPIAYRTSPQHDAREGSQDRRTENENAGVAVRPLREGPRASVAGRHAALRLQGQGVQRQRHPGSHRPGRDPGWEIAADRQAVRVAHPEHRGARSGGDVPGLTGYFLKIFFRASTLGSTNR